MDKKQETLAKDILLICKHRFNTEKYKTIIEALNAYYHKWYGCEDIVMDCRFAVHLFIRPTVEYFLTKDRVNNFLNQGLFCETYAERCTLDQENKSLDFYEVLYYRMITWLCLLNVSQLNDDTGQCDQLIDLSSYPLHDDNWEGVI